MITSEFIKTLESAEYIAEELQAIVQTGVRPCLICGTCEHIHVASCYIIKPEMIDSFGGAKAVVYCLCTQHSPTAAIAKRAESIIKFLIEKERGINANG